MTIDQRFYKVLGSYKISEIAERIECEIDQQITDNILITDVKSLDNASKGDISFLWNNKYKTSLMNSDASACIVPEDFVLKSDINLILLKSKNTYLAYKKLIDLFYAPKKIYKKQIMPSAYISPTASIGRDCYIGHNVVIEDNVIIGDESIIESGSFIDFAVTIGKRAFIHSNVSISHTNIGDDVLILPGAKIGQDGFGFATNAGIHSKIYHRGRVIIGNDVEIGANVTIDRGSIDDTVIGDLCRIDNLVQIAHNVKIGKGSIIVAQVGIAGSSVIGNYCALGGQVGVAGHISIGDKAQISAQGGVIQNVTSGAILGGTPAVPIQDWHRQSLMMKSLIRRGNKK